MRRMVCALVLAAPVGLLAGCGDKDKNGSTPPAKLNETLPKNPTTGGGEGGGGGGKKGNTPQQPAKVAD